MFSDLDKAYENAYSLVSKMEQKLPPDIMLRLYAYSKQAKKGDNFSFSSKNDIKSAFKFNAWIQLRGMTEEEAKKEYINLVNQLSEKIA